MCILTGKLFKINKFIIMWWKYYVKFFHSFPPPPIHTLKFHIQIPNVKNRITILIILPNQKFHIWSTKNLDLKIKRANLKEHLNTLSLKLTKINHLVMSKQKAFYLAINISSVASIIWLRRWNTRALCQIKECTWL